MAKGNSDTSLFFLYTLAIGDQCGLLFARKNKLAKNTGTKNMIKLQTWKNMSKSLPRSRIAQSAKCVSTFFYTCIDFKHVKATKNKTGHLYDFWHQHKKFPTDTVPTYRTIWKTS